MIHDRANWRMTARRIALASVALALISLNGSAVHAQSIMRSPSINVGARIPSINPTITPRIDPGLVARTSPNLRIRPACGSAYRDGDGACLDQPVTSSPVTTVDGAGGSGASGKGKNGGPRRNVSQVAGLNSLTVANEIVAEIDGTLTDAQADALARRHGLARLRSQNFPLIGATIGLFRITDRRSIETVSREFAADAGVRSVQPSFRYLLQEQNAAPSEGDPAQYALAKLRLPEAHTLAHGANITVAVINSSIDAGHPELAGAIADSFDALGSKEGPHLHGTGVAGAIVAHARLMGSAPAARILAIRAFSNAPKGAESTTFVLLKGLDYATSHGARIINMSFAGPKDPLIERGIAAIAAKGILMVAASGNAGPKSPPLYPAANPNVIAVSATDAQDKFFAASNRGPYIAVAAPGVDIFLPAPDEKYQMVSGTSFSAAYVSGLAALMLERNSALKPDELRAILMKTARDLGAPGRDDLFGAGEADAYAAVSAAGNAPLVAATDAPQPAALAKGSERQDAPSTRALTAPAAAMAADKPAATNRPSGR